jgi:peroxidase
MLQVPLISQGFTTAAFRQGHTFIQGQVRLHDSRTFKFIESISLRHLFKRPFHYYNPGECRGPPFSPGSILAQECYEILIINISPHTGQIDKVMAGALNTPAQSYDPFITQEIAGHLFQEPGEAFGMDLISINLQRAREQGVPGYVAYRERFTLLPKVRTFEDLLGTMSNRTVVQYSRMYKSVHDIDLWSGGVSEIPRDGALVGPTFAAIIGQQFAQIKNGDRFWYENANQPSSFTMAQLREIKKSSLARLLCINSDRVQLIQRKALKLPHQIYNPLMACKDLNDVDLRYWREDPNMSGQFFE